MTRQRPRWAVAAVVVAGIVELAATVGWIGWRSVVVRLSDDPTAGADALAASRWLDLPETVARLRRAPLGTLRAVGDQDVARALARLGREQTDWAPAADDGFVNIARSQLIRGAVEEAAETLDAALDRNPTSPVLHRLTALVEDVRGRRDRALAHLAEAQGLAPGTGLDGVDLTPEEAARVRLEGLHRRLELYPRSRSQGIIDLAREMNLQGQREAGRGLLEEESTRDPRIAIEASRWDLDDGQPGRADERLSAIAARHGLPASMSARIWALRASVRDRLGDPEGAIEAARVALSFDPTSPTPHRVLAQLAERRGDLDEALEHLRRAWGMNPTDARLLSAIASVAERAGAHDDARLALERAVAVEPDDAALRARLVELLLRRGELMPATFTLSDALERFPDDPRLLRLADRLRSEVSRR